MKNRDIVFLLFRFCNTHLEVPQISMNMYHLESYNFMAHVTTKVDSAVKTKLYNLFDKMEINCV